jgi:putative DNA primase/helicase
VFTREDPYCGVDLNIELLEAEREAIALSLDSYTEESLSGGWHVIVRASLNGGGRHPRGFGVFDSRRYFVMTGEHVNGTPTTIEERQAELDAVLAQYLPKPSAPTGPALLAQPVDLNDHDLLRKAFAAKNGPEVEALWQGEWERRYPSHSEADLAFCNQLAFWTGRDAARMDRLFRESGLMRTKWDEHRKDTTYGAQTIARAIANCDEVYEPLVRNVGGTPADAEVPLTNTREVPTDITDEQRALAEVEAAFAELLLVKDTGGIKVTLATIVANYAPGDALGTILVAPSGGGR